MFHTDTGTQRVCGIEPIKKTQTEEILDMENLEKRTGTKDTSIITRIQKMQEIISSVEDMVKETVISIKRKC
jgi:TPP-dependent indolepyruvate ferredoxin oxidoreductase alpha subunit